MFIVGSSFSGKYYLSFKELKNVSASLKVGSAKTLNWNAFKRTKSDEQYIDDLNCEEEIRENSEFEGATVVFADTLEHNQKQSSHSLHKGITKIYMFTICPTHTPINQKEQ